MNIKKIICLSLTSLLFCFMSVAYAANSIKQIRSQSLDDKLQIVIDTEQNPDYKVFVLSNPNRIVVDVQGRPVAGFSNRLNFKKRGVRKVRTGMNEDDKVRIVLDLVRDYRWKAFELKPDGSRGNRVVVEIFDRPNGVANVPRKALKPNIETGTSVSDQQLVLESVNETKGMTFETIATKPKFSEIKKPSVDSSNQQLVLESPVGGKEKSNLDIAKKLESNKPSFTLDGKPVLSTNKKPKSNEPTLMLNKNTAVPKSKKPKPNEPTFTLDSKPIVPKNQKLKANTLPKTKKPKEPVIVYTETKLPKAALSNDLNLKKNTLKKNSPALVATTPKPRRSRYKTIVVMIDPGHGGKDPGAIGKGGTREKHVVLQIAKRLKKRINQTRGMNAVLTRSTDKYITLRGRLALANRHKPDIFVSIHADAAQNRSASGSSIYILSNSGASSKTAKWIAKRENAVDSKYGGDLGNVSSDVSNVLLGMQQDITIESSHAAANKTLKRLKGIGKVHKRRVERAGFAVLKYPSIPSMLVETAFLSNPEEERKLQKISYQDEIADAVASGIEEYFRSQGKL